jgi:DNA polymerase-3 subunit epsilon
MEDGKMPSYEVVFPFSIFHLPCVSWFSTPVHVLDFEGSRPSGVVEYGVATLLGGKITAVATRLCAPAGPVAAAESALHGISPADTAGAAPFAAAQTFFAELRQTGPFAAHHAPIERALLRRAWPVPPAAPDFAAPNPAAAPRVSDWGPWLDTRRIYEGLYPTLPNFQLMEIIQAFALADELQTLALQYCPAPRRRPHCALFDALAAALLLARLAQEPPLAAASLAWLLAQSVPPDQAAAINQGEFSLEE